MAMRTWWDVQLDLGASLRESVSALTPTQRDDLRDAIDARLADHVAPDGSARIPARSHVAVAEAYAMRAGVDIPLFAKDYATAARAADALVRAARDGSLARDELDRGALRVLGLRQSLAE